MYNYCRGPSKESSRDDGKAVVDEAGIIPRSITALFTELSELQKTGTSAIVHASYLQIYNNDIMDLFHSQNSNSSEVLEIKESIHGNALHMFVSNLSEIRVECPSAVISLLKRGNQNRCIRATDMNQSSSRSHAILTLRVEVASRGTDGGTILRQAKLTLVDLAGSEKWNKALEMDKTQIREMTEINSSLSALGNVISALSQKKRRHIPYRDSKLTRYLQDSLGGNTRTTIIATVSSTQSASEETVSTLQFADRAKRVMARIQVNELVDDAVLLARAQREIVQLKVKLKSQDSSNALEEVQAMVAQLRIQLTRSTKEVDIWKNRVEKLKSREKRMNMRPKSAAAGGPSPGAVQYTERSPLYRSSSLGRILPLLSTGKSRVKTLKTPQKIKTSFKSTKLPLAETIRTGTTLKVQKNILETIQAEKRQLELELQKMGPEMDGVSDQGEDDEMCPVCGLVVDDHSDTALDKCIALEANISEDSNRPETNLEDRGATLLARSASFIASLEIDCQVNDSNEEDTPVALSNPKMVSKRTAPLSKKLKKNSKTSSQNISISAKKKLLASPYLSSKMDKTSLFSPLFKKNQETLLHYTVTDIGRKLQVYKFRYDTWYVCTIVGYDSTRKLHCCQYDYGDKQWQDLSHGNIQNVA